MSEKSPPPESLLPYEAWTEDAMREVAWRALEHAAKHGMPGEHHFYLSYRTDHPGVAIPGHLKAKYPEEITIVLQHQFEGLFVDRVAERFGVTLHFGGAPAKLVVPFGALKTRRAVSAGSPGFLAMSVAVTSLALHSTATRSVLDWPETRSEGSFVRTNASIESIVPSCP